MAKLIVQDIENGILWRLEHSLDSEIVGFVVEMLRDPMLLIPTFQSLLFVQSIEEISYAYINIFIFLAHFTRSFFSYHRMGAYGYELLEDLTSVKGCYELTHKGVFKEKAEEFTDIVLRNWKKAIDKTKVFFDTLPSVAIEHNYAQILVNLAQHSLGIGDFFWGLELLQDAIQLDKGCTSALGLIQLPRDDKYCKQKLTRLAPDGKGTLEEWLSAHGVEIVWIQQDNPLTD